MSKNRPAPRAPGAGESRHALVARHLKSFLKSEAAYRRQDDDDPEIVHDVRVAARRLRAALAATGPMSSQDRTLRRAVKQVARALGGVRDADVQRALLESQRAVAPAKEAPGIDRLVARLGGMRAIANEEALATLNEPGIREVLERAERRFADERHASPSRAGRKGRRTRGDGTQHIAERLDALLADAEASRASGTPAAMHEMRIAAKRLRYTIELDLPALGEPGEDAIDTLKSIQDELGELHDVDALLDLARDELRKVADEEAAVALAGTSPPAKNADRTALLAFVARIAKERAAALETHWSELVAGGLEARMRALANGNGDRDEIA